MEAIKKYIQTIICGVSLVVLFFCPFVNCDYGYYVETEFTGFTMAMNTYVGYLMVVLPAAMAIAPFHPKYKEKVPLFSLVIPPLCIVAWLLTMLFAKTFVSGLAESTLAFGAWLTLGCYIALTVYGCLNYRKELAQIIAELKGKKG